MPQEEFDWATMTIDELFERRRLAKEERSRRLAKLPIEKKLEAVEKFNAILEEALAEDERKRASEQSDT